MEEVIPAEQLTLKRCLGRGGFAIVYAGFYNVDGRKEPVAIKVLCPSEENQGGEDPTAMFLREARQTKRQQHEHIIRCFGLARIPPNHPGVSGISKTAWAMVLELAEPYTTKTLITQGMTDNRRTYTNLQAYTWLTQLASALAHLHSHRPPIIHRDIKQENLLLKKVTRPPPAAATAAGGAGGGVPAGAQRLPGGGGGTQLEAKLADLGLHVVVEQDRSVMLRRKSRYGSNHTAGGNNRSVHNRSMHGSNRSAHGGGSVPGGTDSPFLAVSAAPSAAPSAMPSRAPSEYGIDLSGPFARVQKRLGVNGEGDEDNSGAGGGGCSTGLGVSYASTGGGRISGGGGHQLSGAGGVWAGEDAGGGGVAAEGRRRRRRRISFDRDVKGIITDDEDGGMGSDSDSDSGGSNARMSEEVDIVDIHGALAADSAPPTRPGTANLTAAAAAAAAAAPGTIAAAATASSTAAGGSSRHLPTSRLSRTSLLPAAGAAQPPQPSQGQGQGQGQGQEPPGAHIQPSGSADAIKPRAAAASVGRGRLSSPTAPPGAVQALRESGNSTLPMLGSPSGRRDVLPPLHWNDALFRAASHKHPDGSAGAAIHTLTDGGAGSGADSGFDDSPRPTADGDDGGADGDGAGVGGVEGTRTSPANQGAALAQQLGGSSSRQLPPPVTKRPGYMGASGGEPGSVAVVSAGHNGSLAARPISASSQQQYATPRKSSSGGGGAAASSSALAAAAAAAAAQDPSGGGAGFAGGGGHPRMDLTVAVAEAADAAAAGLYSNTPLEPVETLMSPVPGRMAPAAAGATAGGSTVLAACAAIGTCGGLKGTGSSPGAPWSAVGGGAAAVGSANSAIIAGRAGSGTNNYVGVAAAASSNTGVSTGPAGLPPMILEDYSYIGGLTDADAGGDDRELADNRPGVDFRCGVGQQESGAAAAAGGGGASSGSAGFGVARQSSVSNIVLLPKDGAGPSSRPASKSRLGPPAVVNPLASMAVTAGGGGLGAGTASSQSTSRHCLAMSAPVSRLEMTPRAHQQTLQHPQAALAGVPPSLEHKDSFGTILNRNPELMVAPTGSFTSGLRRVHSVLSQFRQSELKQLRQSSLEWVFGLTGRAGSCMYMAPEVFRKLPYNEKADVFSFGVVMYELLSRELLVISYFNTSRGAKLGMHQPEDYAEMVCDGFRPARPGALANEAAWSLIEACWQDDPVQRPDMDTVLVRLRELQREEELHPTDPGGLMGCSCVIS